MCNNVENCFKLWQICISELGIYVTISTKLATARSLADRR